MMETIHILLVDDDRDDYEFFLMALESVTSSSFNVTWKENGVQALSYLKSQLTKPDLIIMDLNMPLKDGFQTLTEIKSLNNLSHIPVHIFTTSIDHLDKCKHLGCTGYFKKPISLEGYKTSVQNMLAEEYLSKIKAIH